MFRSAKYWKSQKQLSLSNAPSYFGISVINFSGPIFNSKNITLNMHIYRWPHWHSFVTFLLFVNTLYTYKTLWISGSLEFPFQRVIGTIQDEAIDCFSQEFPRAARFSTGKKG